MFFENATDHAIAHFHHQEHAVAQMVSIATQPTVHVVHVAIVDGLEHELESGMMVARKSTVLAVEALADCAVISSRAGRRRSLRPLFPQQSQIKKRTFLAMQLWRLSCEWP